MPNSRYTYNNKPVKVHQHKSIDDRKRALLDFINHYDLGKIIPVMDTMENSFNNHFGIWPFRFMVIENNIMKCIMKHELVPSISPLKSYLI